jgi:hypothetical protein
LRDFAQVLAYAEHGADYAGAPVPAGMMQIK